LKKTLGNKTRRGVQYQRSGQKGLFRRFFSAFVSFAGVSFILAFSLSFLLLVSIALIHGYRLATSSEYLALSEIEIEGGSHLGYQELLDLMEIGPGINMLQLNMPDLHRRLTENPWIEDARLKREFPDQLQVVVREKQAYFWVQNDHDLYYADKSGEIIDRLTPGRFISLPVLHIHGNPEPEAVIRLVDTLESRNFPFSIQEVAWIELSEPDRVEIYVQGPDLSLFLCCTELNSHLKKLNSVWRDLHQRKEINKVNRITVAGDNIWVAFNHLTKP